MSQQQHIDYSTPSQDAFWTGGIAAIVGVTALAAALAAFDAWLLTTVASSGMTGNNAVVFYFPPAGTAVVAVIALLVTFVVKRFAGWGWTAIYLVLSVVLPLVSAVFTFGRAVQ